MIGDAAVGGGELDGSHSRLLSDATERSDQAREAVSLRRRSCFRSDAITAGMLASFYLSFSR